MSRRTPRAAMAALAAVGAVVPALARTQDASELTSAANVNSRYIVEAVTIEPEGLGRLSVSLRDRIQTLAGTRFDQQILEEIASAIRREMTNWDVAMSVARGSAPEQLRVTFQVKRREQEVKLTLPRLVYHSKQNFSFGIDSGFRRGAHTLRAGVLSDNDQLVERFSGVRGGYELAAGRRVTLGANVESWRAQWNRETEAAVAPGTGSDVPGIYRTRLGGSPFVNFALLGGSGDCGNSFSGTAAPRAAACAPERSLTLQLGVSFERLEMQYPAVRHELSSAALGTLRFQRRWEVSSGRTVDLDSGYQIRVGTGALAGDFAYNRHLWSTRAVLRDGHHSIEASVQAGRLDGRAPLFERFVLGNSQTLRGWNRFDLAPLGASRMAHASLDYRYRWLRAIYDAGAVWQGPAAGQSRSAAVLRHSAAIGVTTGGTMQLSALIAFPIRDGAIEPVFITGLYF
ncbi:MAG: BamA/TamA family outer membrane protein [Bryobacteraceae bacterium]